jgi:mRNA interferase HicA
MRRNDLLRRIENAARTRGVALVLVREGGDHEIWRCGGRQISLPRHREINEMTALAIFRLLQSELGEEWWK